MYKKILKSSTWLLAALFLTTACGGKQAITGKEPEAADNAKVPKATDKVDDNNKPKALGEERSGQTDEPTLSKNTGADSTKKLGNAEDKNKKQNLSVPDAAKKVNKVNNDTKDKNSAKVEGDSKNNKNMPQFLLDIQKGGFELNKTDSKKKD